MESVVKQKIKGEKFFIFYLWNWKFPFLNPHHEELDWNDECLNEKTQRHKLSSDQWVKAKMSFPQCISPVETCCCCYFGILNIKHQKVLQLTETSEHHENYPEKVFFFFFFTCQKNLKLFFFFFFLLAWSKTNSFVVFIVSFILLTKAFSLRFILWKRKIAQFFFFVLHMKKSSHYFFSFVHMRKTLIYFDNIFFFKNWGIWKKNDSVSHMENKFSWKKTSLWKIIFQIFRNFKWKKKDIFLSLAWRKINI